MLIIIILALSGLLIYFVKRNKNSVNKSGKKSATFGPTSTNPTNSDGVKFEFRILEMQFPGRDSNIAWHKNAIIRGFADGDLSLVNLSYAKIIERLRQQNVNERGKYETMLETARREYEQFRITYNMQYPPQFLPPKKHSFSPPAIYTDVQHQEIKVRSNNTKLKALIKDIRAKGHPQYPLLRKEYDIVSRMPYMDFSGWIIEQLKLNDYDSLYAFAKEFFRVDGDEEPSFKIKFEKFLTVDFTTLFENVDQQMVYEIRAFFVINYGFEPFNREFWIVEGRQADSLSKILSVYSFSLNLDAFMPLINRANGFIREMSKDNDYWKEFEKYKKEHIKRENKLPTKSDLPSKLQQLTSGERLYFFDYNSSFKRFWNGNSSYKTRSFGINEEKSIGKISNLEIFEIVDDIGAIPQIASKGELKESATRAGFEIKKSWTLEKIYENLLKVENGKAFLSEFIKDKIVLSFKSEYDADLNIILDYQVEIQRIVDLISMI
jgi:hypothetical protein